MQRKRRACRHTRYALSCVNLAKIIISSYAVGALGVLVVTWHGAWPR